LVSEQLMDVMVAETAHEDAIAAIDNRLAQIHEGSERRN
jgi:hypothetical protein